MNEGLFEQFVKSAMSRCRHFNGIQNKQCKAGIVYDDPAHGDAMIPCIPKHLEGATKSPWSCRLFNIVSIEEAKKEARDRVERVRKTGTAVAVARDEANRRGLGKGHGGSGELQCPACGTGILHYSVASYNGHIHGRCSTPGCVSWMQ